MKQKHMFALLDQSFMTVRVSFDAPFVLDMLPPGNYDFEIESAEILHEYSGRRGSTPHIQMTGRVLREKTYVYKVPRAWDVKQGDHLVVLSPQNGLKVVQVCHVDESPDIDLDANFDYKWAVSKVDLTEFRELTEKEKKFNDALVEVERVKQRESLVKSFLDNLPEGSEARKLFEQTTASIGAPVVEGTVNSAE